MSKKGVCPKGTVARRKGEGDSRDGQGASKAREVAQSRVQGEARLNAAEEIGGRCRARPESHG
jgi:hypothetical protein